MTSCLSLIGPLANPRPLIGQVLILIITGLAFSSLAYYIEQGEDSGFTDIPTAFYWVIITMTTVGYNNVIICQCDPSSHYFL